MNSPKRKAQADQVLTAITSFVDSKGYPPTRKELSKEMGWDSPNSAQIWLERLEAMGLIEVAPNISRGIRIL